MQVETSLTEKAIDSVFERLDPEENGVIDYDVFKVQQKTPLQSFEDLCYE